MEHYYSPDDRHDQLKGLDAAVGELLPLLAASTPDFQRYGPTLVSVQTEARALLRNGFDRDAILALGRAVPAMFHPRWEPPLEQSEDGSWRTPAWYDALEGKAEKVVRIAQDLIAIGYRP